MPPAEKRATPEKKLQVFDRTATARVAYAETTDALSGPLTFLSGNIQVVMDGWLAMAEMVSKRAPSDPELQSKLDFLQKEVPKALQSMQQTANSLHDLSKRLKNTARLDVGGFTTCDMREVLNQALQLLPHYAPHTTVAQEVEETLPSVVGSPTQLQLAMLNLLVNAAEAMEGQGEIKVGLFREAGKVRLEITDSGPGVKPEMVEHIWKSFFSTKPPGQGAGMGLPICLSIVALHQGKIWYEAANPGARFTIELPHA